MLPWLNEVSGGNEKVPACSERWCVGAILKDESGPCKVAMETSPCEGDRLTAEKQRVESGSLFLPDCAVLLNPDQMSGGPLVGCSVFGGSRNRSNSHGHGEEKMKRAVANTKKAIQSWRLVASE